MEDELHNLKVVKRKEVAGEDQRSQRAGRPCPRTQSTMRQKMSREISRPESRRLRKMLKNAEVVVEDEVDLDKINIGCKVKILDLEYDEELDYKIVGSTEANSLKGKISNESPVGKALMGNKRRRL